jgi:hypothetical protein
MLRLLTCGQKSYSSCGTRRTSTADRPCRGKRASIGPDGTSLREPRKRFSKGLEINPLPISATASGKVSWAVAPSAATTVVPQHGLLNVAAANAASIFRPNS